jgi:hypothetical protein
MLSLHTQIYGQGEYVLPRDCDPLIDDVVNVAFTSKSTEEMDDDQSPDVQDRCLTGKAI